MPRLKVFIRSPQQRHKLLRFTPVGRKKPITRHAAVIIEAKYLELLRRGYEVTVGRTGDKEIDFVCDKRGEKLYVQVCYLLASGETVNREFGAYDSIRDNFPKYVVSLDEFDMSRNGIKLSANSTLLHPLKIAVIRKGPAPRHKVVLGFFFVMLRGFF